MGKPPTMADVARRAGVDTSTVSRALNPRTSGRVRPETVARVVQASEELGYRLNVLARGLRTQRSRTIGMLIPDLTNPFFPPVVRGVEAALDEADHTLIVVNTDDDIDREERSLRTVVDRQVDGLLLATTHLGMVRSAQGRTPPPAGATVDFGGLPVVLVNRRSDGDVAHVTPDDHQGIALVVEHLLELGHERIGHVAGPADTSTGHARAEAFEAHTTAAGVFVPGSVETASAFAVEPGRAACAALLDRLPDLTAICAANDLLAVGCLSVLKERGLRVPEDVSLVGFNDMPLVDFLEPALTTVQVPQYDMGFREGQMLLGMLGANGDSGGSAETRVELPGRLIVRRSTAEPVAT